MAKQKNHVIYSNDQQDLLRLKAEYEMIGRDTRLEPGVLVVLALPKRYKRKR